MKTSLGKRRAGIAARALALVVLASTLAPVQAAARTCSYHFRVAKPPQSTGMFWIHTLGPQEIAFKYFGKVDKITIWSIDQRVKYYEGPPVASFNSPGVVGISGEGESGSSVRITTDWQSPLPECL